MALEFVRRAQREYDRYIVREWQQKNSAVGRSCAAPPSTDSKSSGHDVSGLVMTKGLMTPLSFRPTLLQQLVRCLFYTVQFGAA